ncbi:hypothetical protein [Pseudoxanthomonas sp. Root630]|uniref:hypothetical protein n=1 Tax=Pseudoxanthomonas sp. Root630 TaxID=1736574 RepID=UPI00070399FC|nr:hypothetical protein [Pseudoxanthomonas sp. Root630]KRA42325.1 hypothetical protein ASD72_13540 [Pseudoxanthomonas sp. Root630]
MIGFDAIALLRRPAATERTRLMDEGQQFIELRNEDLGRLVAAYRANGMSGRPERLQRRFDYGMRCFGIDERGELIAWFWALHGVPRYFDELAWQIPLSTSQVWLRDAFVVPKRRGRRLLIAMMGAGIDVEATPMVYYSDVSVSNVPSLRAHRALGFERFGTVRCLRLGGRWFWRSAPPAGLPAPSGLRADAPRILLTPEELAWHRAQMA